jgi:hypothetical protein
MCNAANIRMHQKTVPLLHVAACRRGCGKELEDPRGVDQTAPAKGRCRPDGGTTERHPLDSRSVQPDTAMARRTTADATALGRLRGTPRRISDRTLFEGGKIGKDAHGRKCRAGNDLRHGRAGPRTVEQHEGVFDLKVLDLFDPRGRGGRES